MSENPISIPQMLMIGSTGRNSGKTTLAVESIKRWKSMHPVVGLKVTSVERCDGKCPRGGEGCGACSSLRGNFDIVEETDAASEKDTSQLLAAGCVKVYWLKVLRSHLKEGIAEFMKILPHGALVICESNSLRSVVVPGAFIMLHNNKTGFVKDSAGKVMELADMVVSRDIREYAGELLNNVFVGDFGVSLKDRTVS